MIKHDLIKRVGGIEKAKAIVEQYKDLETCFKSYRYFDVEKDDFLRKPKPGRVDVINLRTAIAQYEQLGNSEEFKVGDKIIFSAMGNSVMEYQDCLKMFLSQGLIRHATPAEIAAGHRLGHSVDVTDMVTDIHNHISPNTKVVEL